EVRRQDAVVAAGDEDRWDTMQVARRDDVLDALGDAVRLACGRLAERRAGDRVAAGRERAQAECALEVLIRRRDAVLLGSSRRRVVDQVDADEVLPGRGRRRNAVAGAEDLRLDGGIERGRGSRRG